MDVCLLTCTYNRAACLERVIKFYIDQDFQGSSVHVIYNNAPLPLQLNIPALPPHKKIVLVNAPLNQDNMPYNSVGEIFNCALQYVNDNFYPEILTHLDDDDIYLPSHISEGVKGMRRAYKQNMLAYKPFYSYFRTSEGISKAHNTMEPSIFVDFTYLHQTGYKNSVVDYNQGWIDPLKASKQLFIDGQGISTLIYDWSGEIPVFKISGSHNTHQNFVNHHANSLDDRQTITPISDEKAQWYYKLVEQCK